MTRNQPHLAAELAPRFFRRRKQKRGPSPAAKWVALLAIFCHSSLFAAEFTGICVGFDNQYKVGVWTPVELTIRGGGEPMTGAVTLTVPDGDAVPSIVTAPSVAVLPGRESTLRLFARFGQADSTAKAALMVDGHKIAERKFDSSYEADPTHYLSALSVDQRLYVVVGSGEVGLREAIEEDGDTYAADVVARVGSIASLPVRWYGYEGVSAVILTTSRPELYRPMAGGGARLEALDEWIRQGGRLVLSVGRQADEVLAPNAPLARFAPGRLAEVVSLRQTGALENYIEADKPVIRPGPNRVALRSPRLEDVRGVVEAREADLPLIVRTPYGFGEVVFVAADLERSPLADWPERPALVTRLVRRESNPDQDDAAPPLGFRPGYDDLSGQLRSALDQFEGVRLVPFSLVALLIVVYILLVGPGDYLLVKRVFKRMELTWVTFPALIIGVSLGAYGLAYWLKGDQLRMNQVDLLDVEVSTGRARGTTWLNMFSPRVESFNLGLRPALLDEDGEARAVFSWLGLPGGALGGMNPQAGGPPAFVRPYMFAPTLEAIYGVPIQVWSSKSFIGRYSGNLATSIDAELVQTDQGPVGTITNRLPVTLQQCRLLHGDWVYELDTLEPQQSIVLSDETPRTEVKTWLTGRKYVKAEDAIQQETTPYDVSSTAPEYILRAMLFHDAAGGRRYTGGMANEYQSFVDMSDLIELGRAVLLARLPAGRRAAILLSSGEPVAAGTSQSPAMCRFVIEVKQP